jgi:hypothetical protein
MSYVDAWALLGVALKGIILNRAPGFVLWWLV